MIGATLSRRQVLQAGVLSTFGLTLGDWFRLRAASQDEKPKSCILIWLDGGPSHLETFDLKPDAPKEVRGPAQPTQTSVTGLHICEWMPRTAKLMKHVALVRSMTSPLGEHNLASHYVLTGYKPTPALVYPSFGSVVAALRTEKRALPGYIAVPDAVSMAGEGYLPASARPFATRGDPARQDFKVRDLELYPEVTGDRLQRRQDFRASLDRFSKVAEENGSEDKGYEQAYRLLGSTTAKKAFDLSEEKPNIRALYGSRTIGQSCLLARRWVEAGVPFVTVTDRGWDTHDDMFTRLREGYTGGTVGKVPTLDLAFSGLIEDLEQRGLLKSTLVLVMGEFGRTPKINTRGGRDHWPRVFSVALAGGGIKGGQAIGKSDAHGESPAERPVAPEDLARTVYKTLGVNPDHEFHTSDGRPVPVNQNSKIIKELL